MSLYLKDITQEKLYEYKDKILSLYKENPNKKWVAKRLIDDLGIKTNFLENTTEKIRKRVSRFITNHYEELPNTNQDNSEELEEEIDVSQEEYEFNQSYLFDEAKDQYFFFVKDFGKPIVLNGKTVRDLKAEYSQWDEDPATINQICRNYEIPRVIFTKIKSILGWSHDSEPFTDEDIQNEDEDKLVSTALQQRKYKIHKKFEKQKRVEIEKSAKKWDYFEENVLNPLIAKIENEAPQYAPPKINKNYEKEPHALVLSPYDLHFGKYGWSFETNEGYDRAEAEHLLIKKTNDLINKHLINYNLEKIVVPIGSDFFHVDRENFTTNGTPQDTDGTINQIIWEGSQLMVKFIDVLRQISNVEIVMAPGNHDQTVNTSLLLFLYAWYKDSDDVTLHKNLKLRQYILYGNTLLGFAHGDRINEKELRETMPSDVPEYWGFSKFRAFFTGHKHHELVNDNGSVTIYQMPTLSGSDRFHHKRGLENSKRSIVGYLVSQTEGVNANLMSNVVNPDDS